MKIKKIQILLLQAVSSSGNELLKKYKIGGTFLIKVDDTIIMTIKYTDSIDGDLILRLYLSKQ